MIDMNSLRVPGTVAEAIAQQRCLREKVREEPLDVNAVRLVAGTDVSFGRFSTEAWAGIVVVRLQDMQVVDEVVLRDAERLHAHFPVWTGPIDMSMLDGAPSDSGSGSSSGSTLTWKPVLAKPDGASQGPAPAGSGSSSLSLSGASHQIGLNISLASHSLSRTLSVATGDRGSTTDAMHQALRSSTAGGSSATRYSGSSSRSSWSSSSGSSRSSSFSRSSSSSSSRSSSSSSRSSGGGGSRGFR